MVWDAVEAPRHDDAVEVDEADVTYTRWDSPAGAPGLLLVHGMNAHRRWWDFIAPQLIDQYQVAALDLAGMGDADDRYDYSAELWAQSLVAVADAAGLPGNTLIVGHSFWGRIGLKLPRGTAIASLASCSWMRGCAILRRPWITVVPGWGDAPCSIPMRKRLSSASACSRPRAANTNFS